MWSMHKYWTKKQRKCLNLRCLNEYLVLEQRIKLIRLEWFVKQTNNKMSKGLTSPDPNDHMICLNNTLELKQANNNMSLWLTSTETKKSFRWVNYTKSTNPNNHMWRLNNTLVVKQASNNMSKWNTSTERKKYLRCLND